MILIKRKHLYLLVLLVTVLLVFGELRFFMALRSVDMAGNMQVKYEVESFIFASIVLVLIVYLFLVFFIRRSDNVLKRLDKLIELSEYGKLNVGGHLGKLDRLGKKIEYLIYNYMEINEKQALKISSLSGIIDVLTAGCGRPMFMLNRHGNLIGANEGFSRFLGTPREELYKTNYNEIADEPGYNRLFYELEEEDRGGRDRPVTITFRGKDRGGSFLFYPVRNSSGILSHIVAIMETSP